MDPQSTDHRAFDANRSQRCLDAIAHLVRSGRREEAIRLCEEFKKSGEVDAITLDLTLDYLGVKQPSAQIVRPMTEARQLREQGKFPEAEQRLVSLLQKNPADTEAAMLLMRIYAQDLRQPARAYEVLRELEKQTHVSASLIDFARASIHEWSQTKPEAIGPAETHHAESVDGLIAQGLYGSAAEILEGQIKIQADEFEPRLKLAELYAVHCKNVRKAEQIVRELQASPQFSQQQREMAATSLRTWRQSLDIHAR